MPTHVFTSPLMRCVETGDIIAREFGVEHLLIEEGLMEACCEAWMRQWATSDADTSWGGPPASAMKEKAAHAYSPTLQGPSVPESRLRKEALEGLGTILRRSKVLTGVPVGDSPTKVDLLHQSYINMASKQYRWGTFETKAACTERAVETVQARREENLGKTIVFVSHGGPTTFLLEEFVGQPLGAGGMAALSILRWRLKEDGSGKWDGLLRNDARHSPSAMKRKCSNSDK